MSETIALQGRAWPARELEQIRQWVAENLNWSRYRLSRELCARWGWLRPNGQLADMAARSFLNKLHERGVIQLPPCRRASPNRMKHRRLECVPVDSSPVAGELGQLGTLELHEVSRDPTRRAVFETLLATEHYLGYRSPIGDYAQMPIMRSCAGSFHFRCGKTASTTAGARGVTLHNQRCSRKSSSSSGG